jgi:hypothetical protein
MNFLFYNNCGISSLFEKLYSFYWKVLLHGIPYRVFLLSLCTTLAEPRGSTSLIWKPATGQGPQLWCLQLICVRSILCFEEDPSPKCSTSVYSSFSLMQTNSCVLYIWATRHMSVATVKPSRKHVHFRTNNEKLSIFKASCATSQDMIASTHLPSWSPFVRS